MKIDQLNLISLLESSPSGDVWKVIIIEEGLSKNGKYYTKESLQNAIPLFEKSKVCFYEWKDKFYDHIPLALEKLRPEGFPLQTAGYLDNIKYETVKVEGREVSGLTGMLHFLENNNKITQLKNLLVEGWKKGLKNLLGLSINAEGPSSVRMLNGTPITVVSGITKVYSTDFVTQPAAGGGLLKLVESINQKGGVEQMWKKFLEALKVFSPKLLESVDLANITEEEVIAIFESLHKEAKEKKSAKCSVIESILGKMKEKKFEEAEGLLKDLIEHKETELTDEQILAADPSTLTEAQKLKKESLLKAKKEADDLKVTQAKQAELDEKNKSLEARMKEMDQNLKKRECKEMLNLMLGESNLPMPIRDKIRKGFESRIFQESELKESIKSETETLAKLVESGTIIDLGGGASGTYVERETITRLQASMDLTLGHVPTDEEKGTYKGIEKFRSLRESYVAFTDDPQVTGKMGPAAIARMQEAIDDGNTFAYALGYSMQRRMLPAYKSIEPLWKKIAVSVPVNDFKLQERIRWGGFGVLPQVQAARTVAGTPIDSATPTYPELGFPTDEEAKYAVATKGGLVTITRRMIIDDDLRVLAGLPGKIGKAAINTLNQFVFDLMLGYTTGINVATIYDSVAMYATAHKNYRTVALGYDNLYTLLNDMYYQCEWGYKSLVGDNPLAAAATTLNVTGGTGQYFKAGDMIWMDGEICQVTAVATDALTIIRGMFGTTDAQHAQNVVVYKVTQIIGIQNPILWVPRGLRGTALALRNSEKHPENAEGGTNTLRDMFEAQTSPYLRGNENNYYLSAQVNDLPGIEVGFLNGREEPELLVQDQPTQGNVFVYDQIRYKVRHEYGGAVTDFRAFAASIVA